MSHSNKQPERLKVSVSVKRPRRFKAGADSGSAINLVAIHLEEGLTEESVNFQIQLVLEKALSAEGSHCKID